MTTYDNAGLPGQAYDAPVVQQQQQQSAGIFDMGWLKSLKGILKLSEIGISLIVVITSSVWESKVCCTGGGWVQFVSTTALVCTAILFMLYFVGVAEKIKSSIGLYNLIEFIFNASLETCYFISAVVAASFGYAHASIGASAEYGYFGIAALCFFISGIVAAVFGWRHPSIAASSFFCFAALVPYGIDTFFSFQTWRMNTPPPPSMPPQQTPGSMDTMERGPQY